MNAFRPLGEKPRWRIVYEILTTVEVGDVVTYDEMADRLGLHSDKDRHAIQMAVRRASLEFEQVDKRALDSVKNLGYRVVETKEHLELAYRHQRKAGRSLERGHSKTVNVDLTGMSEESRHAFEVVARAFSMQMDFNRRMDVRHKRLEEVVSTVTKTAERSLEEIAALRERLDQLELGNRG